MAASPGIIAVNTIPGWPSPPAGVLEACVKALTAAGYSGRVEHAPEGLIVADVPTVQGVLSSYVGGSAELSHNKALKQAALDTAFDANFDLAKFIRGGTATNITAGNIGTFLAAITNNYRGMRASIAGAASLAALNAININSGWPGNP